MTDIAIRVENLSKLYHIGRAQVRHDTCATHWLALCHEFHELEIEIRLIRRIRGKDRSRGVL